MSLQAKTNTQIQMLSINQDSCLHLPQKEHCFSGKKANLE